MSRPIRKLALPSPDRPDLCTSFPFVFFPPIRAIRWLGVGRGQHQVRLLTPRESWENTGARAPGVDLGPETPPSPSPTVNTPTTALPTRKPLVFHSGRHMHFVSNIVCLKTKDSLGDDPSAERHALEPLTGGSLAV